MQTVDPTEISNYVNLARQGDPEAAHTLVGLLYPMVLRIVRSNLPRRHAEEDMTQEIFIKMFSRLSQYERREDIPFEHWLSRLAVTTCLDALRAEKRRPELRWSDLTPNETIWLEYLVSDTPTPEGSDASAREVVEKLLAELPHEDRLVISLMDLEEKSVSQISQMTGWSQAKVKVRAFRARHRLKKQANRLRKTLYYE